MKNIPPTTFIFRCLFLDVLLSNAMTCVWFNFKSFYNKYSPNFWHHCMWLPFALKVKEKNINKYCFCCGGFPILTERSEQLWLWNPSEMGDSCLWLEFCWLLPISLCTPSWASTLKASTANYKKSNKTNPWDLEQGSLEQTANKQNGQGRSTHHLSRLKRSSLIIKQF